LCKNTLKMIEYDPSNIVVLTMQEAIRKRPGMYLGSTDLRGVLNLFYEIITELNYYCSTLLNLVFEIKNENKYSISVQNIDVERMIHRLQNQYILGAENGYNFGLECLIVFSKEIELFINADKQYFLQKNEQNYQLLENEIKQKMENNLTIDFSLNENIFETTSINFDVLLLHFQRYTYLNPHIKLVLKDPRQDILKQHLLYYPNGIADEMDKIVTLFKYSGSEFRTDIFEIIGEREYRISFCCSNGWIEKGVVKTYANNDDLIWGGSIEKGMYKGILKALAEIAKKTKKTAIKISKVKERLYAIAHVKGGEMCYTGSVRCKLVVDEVEEKVAALVCQKCITTLDNEAFYTFFKR
jgi:DNA gyrase/topoisomerase IV subunit B